MSDDKNCEYHQSPCAHLEEHRGDAVEQMRELRIQQQALNDKMDAVLKAVGSVHEVLTAWNNAKGFVNTVQTISKLIKWATPPALLIAATWYFVTHGNWPK